MGESGGADAGLGGSVVDMVSWAGFTSISVGIPKSRGSAGAPVSGIHCGEVGGADALALGRVPDVISGAVLALLSSRVEVLGGSTVASAGGGGNGAGRAADLVGPCGRCACGADACEESLVKDHTLGAAGQLGGLFMRESSCIAHSEHGQEDDGYLAHKIF